MKKTIIRISAAILLVGGLAFNFTISNENNNGSDFDLNQLLNNTKAFGEDNDRICPNESDDECKANGYWMNGRKH